MTAQEKARVLIVDDQPGVVDVMGAILTTHGFDVDSASNGLEGLERVEVQLPDIILLDISMPHMDARRESPSSCSLRKRTGSRESRPCRRVRTTSWESPSTERS
jgi:DNA-binding response OmpR family regulator